MVFWPNEYNMTISGSVFDGPGVWRKANRHNRYTFLFRSDWLQMVLHWLGIASVAPVPARADEPLAIFDVGRRGFAPKISYIFGTREPPPPIEIPEPPSPPPAPPGGGMSLYARPRYDGPRIIEDFGRGIFYLMAEPYERGMRGYDTRSEYSIFIDSFDRKTRKRMLRQPADRNFGES